MNVYTVWTHVGGEETVEAMEFQINGDGHLLFHSMRGPVVAAFSSGSWVSVQLVKKES